MQKHYTAQDLCNWKKWLNDHICEILLSEFPIEPYINNKSILLNIVEVTLAIPSSSNVAQERLSDIYWVT